MTEVGVGEDTAWRSSSTHHHHPLPLKGVPLRPAKADESDVERLGRLIARAQQEAAAARAQEQEAKAKQEQARVAAILRELGFSRPEAKVAARAVRAMQLLEPWSSREAGGEARAVLSPHVCSSPPRVDTGRRPRATAARGCADL